MSAVPDPRRYDRVLVAFSGGKDSLATLLHLLAIGVSPDRIELHHHAVDGDGPNFMDWPCTGGYVRAVADHLGLPLFHSWREGGFARELDRQLASSAPVIFETPDGLSHAGGAGPPGTRGLFPQLSADLRVRWCSPALKIDVLAASIRNQARYQDGSNLVVTGERAEESVGRARYAMFEPHRTATRMRHVDHWRPILPWSESEVFFRHIREDGSCPARTRSQLSAEEITARKYHGLRESKPHRDIKALIQRSLAADPQFSGIAAETTWRSTSDPDRYRRPDVQATLGDQRYAFEVQLSTTFLSVVAGRRAFYRAEGALLVWIFGAFDPAYRRLTTDDLLFSNNSNVFVVDAETTALSEETQRFHLRCFHREPFIARGQIDDRWTEIVLPLDALTCDLEGQRLFAFDYAAAEAGLRAELAAAAAEREAHLVWIDQADFRDFWLAHAVGFKHTPENRAVWIALRERFALRGITLPLWPDHDDSIRAMLNALYTLRTGTPVGWNYDKLVQVAHNLAEYHPALMSVFGFAVKHFDRADALAAGDQSGKWRARVAAAAAALGSYDPAYRPPATVLPLLGFLFPEIAAKVEAFWAKAEQPQNGMVA